ncbi:MAG TPA: helix-turn-helix domain-containing protein [Solirubrobacteraceae bacterium]|jgi:predicted ArsR family transcriptional regulator
MLDVPDPLDPSDALAQPTRAHLFRLLGELARPATTVELAERLDLHPNGVRIHLDRLERDGLVARATEARPRGRPRDRWTIAPGARPGGRPPGGYHDLARWLSRAITAGRPSLRSVEATGRQIGRELAPTDTHNDEHPLMSSLTALGFQPRASVEEDATLTVCLGNCPYRDVGVENQAAICTLHRGITHGLLDVLHPGARLNTFEPRDPETAGCVIRISGIPAAAAQA